MAGSLGGFGNVGGYVPYSDMVAAVNADQFGAFTLNSAGTADTIQAQQLVQGFYIRSGATAAVSATTDTAANIIQALGQTPRIGQSFVIYYINGNTAAGAVTLVGGTGVTISGTALVSVGNGLLMLGQVTSASTVTLNGLYQMGGQDMAGFQYTAISSGNGTVAAGAMEGSAYNVLATSGATALTTRTAAQIITQAGLSVGQSYVLRVVNTNAGTLTLTGGSGVTITGTATLATNTTRDYGVTVNNANGITFQNIGSGTL